MQEKFVKDILTQYANQITVTDAPRVGMMEVDWSHVNEEISNTVP